MSDLPHVTCIRCHQTREAIEGASYGGKIGEEIKGKVCNICWKEWYEQSIKIINEYRLNLREASAREFLSTQMKIFLGLLPAPSSATPQDILLKMNPSIPR